MLSERTALITGASSGFGLLTTITLARRGWRVLATMRDLARREKLEAAAREAGVLERIEFLALDVTDNVQIAELAASIAARPVALHAVVNNAGFAMAGFAEDVSDAELRRQFDTNFFGAAAVTRAFLPQLRRQGHGHIVMVTSGSGRMGFPGVGSYVASKFALEGWTETLRLEMKAVGIQVALVEPGSFETDIWTRNALLSTGTRDTQSPNAARVARWRSRMDANTNKKANPQIVAAAIANLLETSHPRLRTVVGSDIKLGLWLRRLLPWSVFERIVTKAAGLDG